MRSEAEVRARLEEYRAVYHDYLQDLKRSALTVSCQSSKKQERNIILNIKNS